MLFDIEESILGNIHGGCVVVGHDSLAPDDFLPQLQRWVFVFPAVPLHLSLNEVESLDSDYSFVSAFPQNSIVISVSTIDWIVQNMKDLNLMEISSILSMKGQFVDFFGQLDIAHVVHNNAEGGLPFILKLPALIDCSHFLMNVKLDKHVCRFRGFEILTPKYFCEWTKTNLHVKVNIEDLWEWNEVVMMWFAMAREDSLADEIDIPISEELLLTCARDPKALGDVLRAVHASTGFIVNLVPLPRDADCNMVVMA